MNTETVETLLTPGQVAQALGVDVETLNTWRATKRYNLPWVKVGRLVRYRASDVQAFIESRLQGGAGDEC